MKKTTLSLFTVFLLITLMGCSAIEEVTNSANYVVESADFVNDATKLSNELPTLFNLAIENEQKRKELEAKLLEMKDDIQEFAALNPPAFAEEFHLSIIEINTRIEQTIDIYLENIENGTLNSTILENNQIFDEIKQLTDIVNQIKNLGQ